MKSARTRDGTGRTNTCFAFLPQKIDVEEECSVALVEKMYIYPTHQMVRNTLIQIVSEGLTGMSPNGGYNFNMWATIVDRDGFVRVVTFSGNDRGEQFPGSRIISAQKAFTANAFSLPHFSVSSSNMYAGAQPGGIYNHITNSHPVDTHHAYSGMPTNYGTINDPMVFKKIGGVSVFGGGLALYNREGEIIGGLGVSGDTSCADHIVAWKLRNALGLDYVPSGPNPISGDDNIIFDFTVNGMSMSGWGHPLCGDAEYLTSIVNRLPPVRKV